MAGIDKAAFLASVAGGDSGGAPPGEAPMEEETESLSCGEQLVRALGLDVDPGPVDAALKEAVARYGQPQEV